MDVDSIRGVVAAAIQRASDATGVDFAFMLGAAGRESAFNPSAHARTSSAAGLFQIVDQTWLATLKEHGAKYGYARYAELIHQGADGRYFVQGSAAHRAVMDLRLDPHAASLMAGELATDHAAYLRGRMGRPPTAGELYAAHVLGSKGAAKLIDTVQTNPSATAAAVFPEEASANHGLFYRGGRAVSVSELYADLTHSSSTSAPPAATSGPVQAPRHARESFFEYAQARRLDREAQGQTLEAPVLRGRERADGEVAVRTSMLSGEMLRALAVPGR